MNTILTNLKKIAYGSFVMILFLIFWQIGVSYIPSGVIPPPTKVFASFVEIVKSGELFKHTYISLKNVLAGFGLAMVVTIPLGFLLGTFFKTFEKVLLPFLRMLEKLNPFAIIPVFMIIFGVGNLEKIAVIFWSAQWPLLFNTIAGAKNIDPLMIKSARSMGATRRTLFLKVILPYAVPNIFTGIAFGARISFFMIVASEMIGSSSGLGWYYISAHTHYRLPLMFAIMLFITLLANFINVLVSKLEKHFLVWRQA